MFLCLVALLIIVCDKSIKGLPCTSTCFCQLLIKNPQLSVKKQQLHKSMSSFTSATWFSKTGFGCIPWPFSNRNTHTRARTRTHTNTTNARTQSRLTACSVTFKTLKISMKKVDFMRLCRKIIWGNSLETTYVGLTTVKTKDCTVTKTGFTKYNGMQPS